ncbi:hypothetical protein CVO76_07640, partial [Arthrobacter agilis]
MTASATATTPAPIQAAGARDDVRSSSTAASGLLEGVRVLDRLGRGVGLAEAVATGATDVATGTGATVGVGVTVAG